MRPKGMEDLAAFKVREVKRAAAEERERDEYSSAEGQVQVKVGGKTFPASFLNIKGRGMLVGGKDRRERDRWKNW